LETVHIEGDPYLTEIASHLIKAGGKRQRPHMTAAAAAIGLPDGQAVPDDVIRGGVAVELVQVGSLYHDDVMDEAQIRRQVSSVNARWGNLRAILAGDYLLAKASEIAASLGTEVAGLLASTIGELCKGQVAELQTLYDVNRTEQQYYPSIAGKTASLFAAATRIGGIVAEFERDVIDRLTEFGRLYGMAFQVVDDILDVVATDPGSRALARSMMLEAQRIAVRLGVHFRVDVERRINGAAKVGAHRTSMLQDLERGRPLEIDALLTVVQEMGRMVDVETPHIDSVLALVQQLGRRLSIYPTFPEHTPADEDAEIAVD